MSKHNTTDQSVIVCPHCGHCHDDSHEWGQYGRDMDDEGIDDCTMCREPIQWSRIVMTTYTTQKATTEKSSAVQKEVQG